MRDFENYYDQKNDNFILPIDVEEFDETSDDLSKSNTTTLSTTVVNILTALSPIDLYFKFTKEQVPASLTVGMGE